MRIKIILAIFTLFIVNITNAQNYHGLLNESRHLVSVGVNANPNINANIDYLFGYEPQNKTIEQYGFVAQANFPFFSQKGFDFDFRIGAGALLKFIGRFKTITGVSLNLSRTEDINGRYFHSGFKIDLFPGYYDKKWVYATHLAINYQPWINIKHNEYAVQAFEDLYPNRNGQFNAPKNGWFYQNNIILQMGFNLVYFQPKWYLNLTAGLQHQPNRLGLFALPDIGIMPFYAGLNFGYSIIDK